MAVDNRNNTFGFTEQGPAVAIDISSLPSDSKSDQAALCLEVVRKGAKSAKEAGA